jgi:methionyl-tRNA synthetase
MILPAMPTKAEELWAALGLKGKVRGAQLPAQLGWKAKWEEDLAEGRVAPGEALFPRLAQEVTDQAAAKQRPAASGAGARGPDAPVRGPNGSEEDSPLQVSFEEFGRLDLRVATVKAAERVPKADRLVRLEVSLGEEARQIVAGIGEQYSPEELVGKQVVMITNLKPATIRGVRSEGMLLAAIDDKRTVLVRPETDVPSGSPVE